jgi:hypothetical protein
LAKSKMLTDRPTQPTPTQLNRRRSSTKWLRRAVRRRGGPRRRTEPWVCLPSAASRLTLSTSPPRSTELFFSQRRFRSHSFV